MKTRQRVVALSSLCFSLALASGASADGGASSILLPNEVLFAGQSLVSDSCYYHVEMQASDGNLVLYKGEGSAPEQALWSLATVSGATVLGSYAVMQTDGNFIIDSINGEGPPIWATGTNGTYNELSMQDDGNLVIYDYSGAALWATHTVSGEYYGSPCTLQSHVTQILGDANLAGRDFNRACSNDYHDCGNACASMSGCVAWTWTPPGDSGSCSASEGQCWYKSSIPAERFASGMVSGIIHTSRP
jgi:hypothetical protein